MCFAGYAGSACDTCAYMYTRLVPGGPCVFLPGSLASCSNGVRDGNELGVDCGGPNCASCHLPLLSPAEAHTAQIAQYLIVATASTVVISLALLLYHRGGKVVVQIGPQAEPGKSIVSGDAARGASGDGTSKTVASALVSAPSVHGIVAVSTLWPTRLPGSNFAILNCWQSVAFARCVIIFQFTELKLLLFIESSSCRESRDTRILRSIVTMIIAECT